MKRPLPFEEFKAIYSRVTRLSLDLVIAVDGGVLLIERSLESYKGQWHLPGGTVYFKEKLTDAAKRIVREETGLEVEPGKLLGYLEYQSEEKERGFGFTIGLVFSCSHTGGDLQLNDEGSNIRSFSKLPINTITEQKQFLESIGF